MRSTRGGASAMMIGRERELRRLTRLASSRRPQVAIITGEPGIGKTRLIRELLATLPSELVVLVGHAEPGSLARPYEVLLDAVDGRNGVEDGALDALTDPARSPVERLHTGLAIVDDLIGDRPAVVVFEDLHWADSESAALFERIADQTAPRLLIGTSRTEEVTSRHPLTALLDRLKRRHGVTQVSLQRLDEAETAALLAAVAGRPVRYRVVAALRQRTGGNPFFLEELLRGHENDLESLPDHPLPWSLAEVLRQQVDGLATPDRRIVDAAAVLGHRVSFDLLAAVTGVSEDELIAALRELVDRGVLAESGEDEFSFRHALVREAISAQLLGRERRRLHEAALEALSLWGALTLQRAVAAARTNRAEDAYGHLDGARAAAGRLGGDRNDYNTEFGPTNVALHEINVAVELGDAGVALRTAATIDASGLSSERQARMLIDVARAHTQRRQVEQAVSALESAEAHTPQQIQGHPLVRQLVSDLFTMQDPPSVALRELARRTGVFSVRTGTKSTRQD